MLLAGLILLPVLGMLSLLLTRGREWQFRTATYFSGLTFFLSLAIWAEFEGASSPYQFSAAFNEASFGHIRLGLDALSLYFVMLTTFTLPLAILASWKSVKRDCQLYLMLLLLLESFLLCAFTVLDLFLFYVFFEAVLLPVFLLIVVWGASEAKVRAGFLLFLYTLLGSLFMLFAFIYIYSHVGSTDMMMISLADLSVGHQLALWLAIFVSLAVKTPLVPFHIWLSRAHVEANLAVSMILAGLILKLATYGFARVLIPFLPEASVLFSPFVQAIAVITLIYASLVCLRQSDFKVLVAYSSIAHMSLTLLALFSNTALGIEGALLLSYAHGFVSPALFICVGGVLYDAYHTRSIRLFRGLAYHMPVFTAYFFLFSMANAGVPLTVNWLGEFFSLLGISQRSPLAGFLLSFSIVLSACYAIWLFNRISFGGARSKDRLPFPDLTKREFFMLTLFMFPTLLLGVYPSIIIDDIQFYVTSLLFWQNF